VREAATGYLFVLPALLIFGIYYAYAIGRSLYLSFTDYKMLNPTYQWIGLENYQAALRDHWVLEGFARAGYFMVLFYIGAFFLPLVVALLVGRVSNPRLSAVYRVLLFLPAIVPDPLVFRLWRWMYMPSFGLINYTLVNWLGILDEGPLWLVDRSLAMPSVAFMSWWGVLGVTAIFFLAGIDAIPPEMFEAARLDGANELQIIRHVTLPLLKNTLIVWTILRIGAFGVVAPMIAMWDSNQAPNAVWTWAYYAWFTGFQSGRLPIGYASAIGWLGALVMVALALLARAIFRERQVRIG
jgi:multiple sugar transport system permease protein